jgi:hypothetical protein
LQPKCFTGFTSSSVAVTDAGTASKPPSVADTNVGYTRSALNFGITTSSVAFTDAVAVGKPPPACFSVVATSSSV